MHGPLSGIVAPVVTPASKSVDLLGNSAEIACWDSTRAAYFARFGVISDGLAEKFA
jgi:hypothetical protein